MKILEAREVQVYCPFDMETFMGLAQLKGLEGKEIVEMIEFWNKWYPGMKIIVFGRKRGYLAIYLEKGIEDEIDSIWEQSPSKGFKLQALVQTMIMGTLRELMPEIKSDQCAPVPKPGTVLKKSLSKKGLEFYDQGTLNYKYSTLTYYPYRGGCDLCYLESSCPKINFPKMEGLFKTKPDQ